MTLDLSKAKVGDKVKHRNGGVSVITEFTKDDPAGLHIDGCSFWIKTGAKWRDVETPFDIVELIPAEDELEKAIRNLADVIVRECSWTLIHGHLSDFAKAIKESR